MDIKAGQCVAQAMQWQPQSQWTEARAKAEAERQYHGAVYANQPVPGGGTIGVATFGAIGAAAPQRMSVGEALLATGEMLDMLTQTAMDLTKRLNPLMDMMENYAQTPDAPPITGASEIACQIGNVRARAATVLAILRDAMQRLTV
jgi:hypothetical protein